MSISIQKGKWNARIAEKGAELRSLTDTATGREYLWSGDPAWWTFTAPVLFPIVGNVKDRRYTHRGRSYSLDTHGFARFGDFRVERSEPDAAELCLSASDATREAYPFEFRLRVAFRLEDHGIRVEYRVDNAGAERMYFSIGSHAGFRVSNEAGALEEHSILFEKEEPGLKRRFLRGGLLDPDAAEDALEEGRRIRLSRTLFDRGALAFIGPRSRSFTLIREGDARSVRVSAASVPYLGIWAPPGGAPFVCIEPWHGIADTPAATGEISEKPGILSLETGGTFETGYRIEVL
jgi:galactose mutarotase-like enzyme